jgi:hypothetical protein
MVLAAIILLLTAVRWVVEVDPQASFWIILLIGITVAVTAMWSIMYRPNIVQAGSAC